MLLAVDIGNSNIKFGTFVGEHLISRSSISTDRDSHPHDFGAALGPGLDTSISDVIISSVVPEMNEPLAGFLGRHLQVEPVFVTHEFDFGLQINYEPPSAAGIDRLVNAFAAARKYGVPCLVCSFGTATTFDVVDRDRVLRGGVIAPGMAMAANALHQHTAKLPVVEIDKPERCIGSTTRSAIQSGVFFGHIALVEGMLARLKAELGDEPQVIATGGLASTIAGNTDIVDVVDEVLLLDGLRLLHESMHQA